MNLDCVKPGLESPPDCLHPGCFEVLDVCLSHSTGLGMILVVRNGAWGLDIVGPSIELLRGNSNLRKPWRNGRCLPARVGELDADFLALGMRKLDDSLQGLDLAILP